MDFRSKLSCFSLLIFTILLPFSLQWSIGDDDSCAILYTNKRFQGSSISLRNKDQISDLYNNYEILNHLDLNTSSFKIAHDCHITLCNDTYMTGECNQFDRDTDLVPEQWATPRSVTCDCNKICKCEDIQLRAKECARAYITDDCSNCDATYTNLKNDRSVQEMPSTFSRKIKSIVAKQNCNVTIISDDDEEGSENIFIDEGGIIENWEGTVSSYICQCNQIASTNGSKSSLADKQSFITDSEFMPPLIDVPKSTGKINSLLNNRYNDHPGLIAALQSARNRRSPTNAYILLLGLTGAGKSTTINLLFDNSSITEVGGIRSTTTNIHEYRIPVQVDELGIRNSELVVIDTPGIVDTRGMEQDARYLATLNEYLAKHDDLKRYIPNVIMVFAKFHDNRFLGEGSNFVKMLRAIDLFRGRLVDRKYSNVIIVLTHYMSDVKGITRKPFERLDAIKKVVEEYSLFPKPIVIVVGENKPDATDVPTVNGYYKLPNGEFYPRNLFDKMDEAAYSGGDPIGEAIFRTAFKNPDNFKISMKKFPLVPASHSKVTYFMGVLSSFDRSTNSTDISELLTSAYETMDNATKIKYPNCLSYMKRALYKRNIQQIEDIPKTSVNILKLFNEIQINPANLYLLDKGLNVTVPVFDAPPLVAHGYDILNDRPLLSTPFELETIVYSDIGFRIPENFQCDVKNQMKSVFQSFVSKEHYMNARLSSLNFERNFISADAFYGNIKPGMNIEDADNKILSSLLEHRYFQFTLKDNPILNTQFQDEISKLKIFNETDWESVESWKSFFRSYGTHIVKSAYGGGSIQITIQDDENYSSEAAVNLFVRREKLTTAMSIIVENIANSLIRKFSSGSFPENITYQLRFKGGDSKYFLHNFTQSDSMSILDSWRESIMFNPVMLESDLNFVPIRNFVMDFNPQLRDEVEKAAKALFNASLILRPVSVSGSNQKDPISREKISGQGITGDFTIIKEFAAMLKSLSETSRKSNEHFMNIMMEQQKEAIRREEELKEQRRQEMQLELQRLETEAKLIQEKQNNEIELQRIEAEQESVRQKFEMESRMQELRLKQEAEVAAHQMQTQQNKNFMQMIIAQSQNRKTSWIDKALEITTGIGKVISDFTTQAFQNLAPALSLGTALAG